MKIKKETILKIIKEEIERELLKEGVLKIQNHISNENLKLIEDKFRELLNIYLTSDKEEEIYDQAEGFKFKNVAGEEQVVDLILSVGRPLKGEEDSLAFLSEESDKGYYHLKIVVAYKEDFDKETIDFAISRMLDHELIHLIDSKYFKKSDFKKGYLSQKREILAHSSEIYKEVVDFLNSEDEQDKEYLNSLFNFYKEGQVTQLNLFKLLLGVSRAFKEAKLGDDPRFINNKTLQHTMKDKQPYLKHLYKKLWPLIQKKLKEV